MSQNRWYLDNASLLLNGSNQAMFAFPGFVQSAQSSELDTCVKLDFNTDFTFFLESNKFHDPVHVLTESEVIKCSAVLLAQHSDVLRESVKEDNELFLTDNKHVRECLSVLYGGAVKLTEENFQDILKFMVAFDIPVARKQVLDWMSQNRWNLDNASLLLNSSMVANKAFAGKPSVRTTTIESLREEVYKPCRLLFGEHLAKIIRPDSTDVRYQNLDSAMECIISGVADKKELLALLLHQDLIPDYIPWVKMLMDQSSYNLFLNSLNRPDISNKMSLCSRTQFEELFDKIEDFENITLKEYKHLNRYKMKINDKITVVQSLKFMKECGSLYSCWKILDGDGLSVLSTAFTDKSDQFCVIECLFSWVSANNSLCDMDFIEKLLSKTICHLLGDPENISLQSYCVNYVKNTLAELQTPTCNSISGIPCDQYTLNVAVAGVTIGEEIVLQLSGSIHTKPGSPNRFPNTILKFTVKLYPDRIPGVSCDVSIGTCHLYVYAWKVEVNTTTRVPLYSEPDEAYKTIKQFPHCHGSGLNRNANYYGHQGANTGVRFAILGVGV